jgi:hypothetical protein
MSNTIIEKMIIKETKGLSLENLNEVLDFIQFIKAKKLSKIVDKSFERGISDKLVDLDQVSLMHLEEEFEHYKEMYPPILRT